MGYLNLYFTIKWSKHTNMPTLSQSTPVDAVLIIYVTALLYKVKQITFNEHILKAFYSKKPFKNVILRDFTNNIFSYKRKSFLTKQTFN